MSVNREKSSSVLGLVVSLLMHGIFFAGLFVLDTSNVTSSPVQTVHDETANDQVQPPVTMVKTKS